MLISPVISRATAAEATTRSDGSANIPPMTFYPSRAPTKAPRAARPAPTPTRMDVDIEEDDDDVEMDIMMDDVNMSMMPIKHAVGPAATEMEMDILGALERLAAAGGTGTGDATEMTEVGGEIDQTLSGEKNLTDQKKTDDARPKYSKPPPYGSAEWVKLQQYSQVWQIV